EEGKQKLEELTARRYPGKQRRQSQLVEDLITEAFAKERDMSTSSSDMQEPPDHLADATYEALGVAQRRAGSMQAREVYPEHLFLALLEQRHSGTLKALSSLWMNNVRTIRNLVISMGAWHVAEDLYKHGEVLKARVIDYNEGGLIVDVSGIRGFAPISQLLDFTGKEGAAGSDNPETRAKLLNMGGKELQLRIIEINRERDRLILSERLAQQEWRQRRREELLDELKPGEVRRGIVSNLANFGAFVDLGGADGLVHISQLAWSRVNHPSEVLKVGQEVEVQVLSVDKDKKKIALSIKRAEVDPWTTVEQRYTPGQVVTGTITKIAPFGAFARIEDGIEGLIHLSELLPGMDPKASLHEGQQLQLRILRIDAERRRLGLSLRQAEELDKEPAPETPTVETGASHVPGDMISLSLEGTSPRTEEPSSQGDKETAAARRENKSERRERNNDNPLLSNLPLGDEGETTAMAEAFRAAARQRSKEESEASQE
ncbi:MAG TPA: S1 RNA-binding domain-containing protein, partial [Ktedonobacteraceae bacterium]|nr:S1 RNA-binding domain-containing protein [Ktedonobacteraceae bacterium]